MLESSFDVAACADAAPLVKPIAGPIAALTASTPPKIHGKRSECARWVIARFYGDRRGGASAVAISQSAGPIK